MIILDTEGTELIKPDATPIGEQPYLVEFAGVKVDDVTLEEKKWLTFVVNPGVKLPETFTKITGIKESDVEHKHSFAAHYHSLVDFFLGEREMVAHNMGYDSTLIRYTLMRIGKQFNFPWPPKHTCTVEASLSIKGHRLSMSDLHAIAAGKTKEQWVSFAPGQFVKHKSLGKCTIVACPDDTHLDVEIEKSKETRRLKREMFKGAAFEGAHGAVKDVQELLTVVRWLRKEGHL